MRLMPYMVASFINAPNTPNVASAVFPVPVPISTIRPGNRYSHKVFREVISGYVFDNHVNAFTIGELMHFCNKVLLPIINRNVGT